MDPLEVDLDLLEVVVVPDHLEVVLEEEITGTMTDSMEDQMDHLEDLLGDHPLAHQESRKESNGLRHGMADAKSSTTTRLLVVNAMMGRTMDPSGENSLRITSCPNPWK